MPFLCDFHQNPWILSLFAGKTLGGEHTYSIIGLYPWQALGSIQATRHIGLPTIHLKELEIPSSARSRHFPPLSSFSTDTGTHLTQHPPDTYLQEVIDLVFHTALIRHAQEQGKGAFTNFSPSVTKNISRLAYLIFFAFHFAVISMSTSTA